eukprot:759719-Hanusia_phi.AAC.1
MLYDPVTLAEQVKDGLDCTTYCKYSPLITVQCHKDGDCLANRFQKVCCSSYTSMYTAMCAMSESDMQLKVKSMESNSTCASTDCYSATSFSRSSSSLHSLWLMIASLLFPLAALRRS